MISKNWFTTFGATGSPDGVATSDERVSAASASVELLSAAFLLVESTTGAFSTKELGPRTSNRSALRADLINLPSN